VSEKPCQLLAAAYWGDNEVLFCVLDGNLQGHSIVAGLKDFFVYVYASKSEGAAEGKLAARQFVMAWVQGLGGGLIVRWRRGIHPSLR